MGELSERRPSWRRAYLGDGVYIEHTAQGIVLTTENGISVTNRIVLEPEVAIAMVGWIERMVEGK